MREGKSLRAEMRGGVERRHRAELNMGGKGVKQLLERHGDGQGGHRDNIPDANSGHREVNVGSTRAHGAIEQDGRAVGFGYPEPGGGRGSDGGSIGDGVGGQDSTR